MPPYGTAVPDGGTHEVESVRTQRSAGRGHAGDAIPRRSWWGAWSRVAANSFGGPAGQIAVMHEEIVERRRWVGERRFLHALNYCMILPGPEAQQLATYLGWLLRGPLGGLFAGGLFILPGFISIMALSVLFAEYGDITWVEGLFFGISASVIAIVASAVVRIGRKVITNGVMLAVACAAFVGIFVFELSFPLIVAAAAAIGFVGGRRRPDIFNVISGEDDASVAIDDEALVGDSSASADTPSHRRSGLIAIGGLVLWFAPIAVLLAVLGGGHVFVKVGWFFSTAAVLTFGGAYSVLAYIAQESVGFGWLAPGEMVNGLGMAETTPGPLIQVVQFVGFMGPFRDPGTLSPLTAGIFGAILTTWVTFVPSFLWILLGAPYVESLRGRDSLTAALSTVTAAVVGVVLNLAIWFALFTLFETVETHHVGRAIVYEPAFSSLDVGATAIAAAAMIAVFRYRWSAVRVVVAAAGIGIIHRFIF